MLSKVEKKRLKLHAFAVKYILSEWKFNEKVYLLDELQST